MASMKQEESNSGRDLCVLTFARVLTHITVLWEDAAWNELERNTGRFEMGRRFKPRRGRII
jgi:hypothetical protein